MPKLKRLSGLDVVRIFEALGFEQISQRGSHVKLRRILPDGTKQTLTIPAHPELDKGTLKAIYRQAMRYIPESELQPHFYSE
jgi:predicted RNA binding protein YcfA (HicA-like mRNA interferase family)